MSLSKLPSEILVEIFSYIPLFQEQFAALQNTSTEFRSILNHFAYKKPKSLNILFIGTPSAGKTCMIAKLLVKKGKKKIISYSYFLGYSKASAIMSQNHPTRDLYDGYGTIIDTYFEERDHSRSTGEGTVHIHRMATCADVKRERTISYIDTPSRASQYKNTTRAAALADVAVLVVSADPNESMAPLFDAQVRQSCVLLSSMGIGSSGKLVIVVNKMDTIGYSENDFNQIKKRLQDRLKAAGAVCDTFIPVSTLDNVNLINPHKSYSFNNIDADEQNSEDTIASMMPWYKGSSLNDGMNSFCNIFTNI